MLTTIEMRRMMEQRGRAIRRNVLAVCCAVARGPVDLGTFLSPSAAGSRQSTATSTSVFVSPGHFDFLLCSFTLLGVWGQSPHRIFLKMAKNSLPKAVQDCHNLLTWLIPLLDDFPRNRRTFLPNHHLE